MFKYLEVHYANSNITIDITYRDCNRESANDYATKTKFSNNCKNTARKWKQVVVN